ncbi:hypothetical protein HZY88_08370 [Aerococcaceae bacterium DSM 111176]|nr:hypothetical protein [Aerococcaceae bacterium DSM 111176]
MNQHTVPKLILGTLLFSSLGLMSVTPTIPDSTLVVTAQEDTTGVKASRYAPGNFYPFYDYTATGNEMAAFTLTLDYAMDENGLYQISLTNAGRTRSIVYQFTQDGIYEVAFFADTTGKEDFRYHEDAHDDRKSLYFPAELQIGDTFNRGYQQEQAFTVTDILDEFYLGGVTYNDVIVVETTYSEGDTHRFYYAQDIGEIYAEYTPTDNGGTQTTSLSYYGEVPEEEFATVNGAEYSIGLFHLYYEYSGYGNEFAPFSLTLDYELDEDRIYQVSRATSGTTVTYVYQIRSDGIYELAYFPESYEQEDFRYHEDSLDQQMSLFLPLTLQVGDTFQRGYRSEQEYVVSDILREYVVNGELYEQVLVIEITFPDGEIQRYYYAPQIGEIYSEYIYDEAGNSITTSLSYYGGIPLQ